MYLECNGGWEPMGSVRGGKVSRLPGISGGGQVNKGNIQVEILALIQF